MKILKQNKENILITGSAGFVGFHLSKYFLEKKFNVIGIDSLNNYYDLNLKIKRNKILKAFENYTFFKANLNNLDTISKIFKQKKPDYIFHLAAQAGVRYSLENPRDYLDSNIIGTYNLLEITQEIRPKHFLLASTSSVYGSNKKLPFNETQKTDEQMSFYAASKKSCEIMAHSFSHINKLPITAFRFFTVYGPWGRPDMALFKFTKAILNDKEIEVYNFGKMKRDFTFIDDIVYSIYKLKNIIPDEANYLDCNSLSTIAPLRVVNIGNSNSVELLVFIKLLEEKLNKKAKIKFLGLQKGDVVETLSDTSVLKKLIGSRPSTEVSVGISRFVDWYLSYYKY